MGVGDGVVDKEGYASTRATDTIFPDEGIARERFRVGFGGEFGFLEAGYRNGVCVEKEGEFSMRGEEAVTIELEDARG